MIGGAGTGKSLLAAEKARRLAKEGFRTLLVCFNAPLAAMLGEEVEAVAESTGLLETKTFHQLCEDLGREAGVLGERPVPVPQAWWDGSLPRALDDAISALGPRYHAIVVDEGQDFTDEWLLSLESLLFGGKEDVLYVFHDPARAILPRGPRGGSGAAAKNDPRPELPECPADPRCRAAVRRGRARRARDAVRWPDTQSSSRRTRPRTPSARCEPCCIDSGSRRRSGRGTSRC